MKSPREIWQHLRTRTRRQWLGYAIFAALGAVWWGLGIVFALEAGSSVLVAILIPLGIFAGAMVLMWLIATGVALTEDDGR